MYVNIFQMQLNVQTNKACALKKAYGNGYEIYAERATFKKIFPSHKNMNRCLLIQIQVLNKILVNFGTTVHKNNLACITDTRRSHPFRAFPANTELRSFATEHPGGNMKSNTT